MVDDVLSDIMLVVVEDMSMVISVVEVMSMFIVEEVYSLF